MHVMRDDFRSDAEGALQLIHHLLEEAQGLVVLHVADVLAEESVPVAGEAEGVLELRPYRQHLGNRER